MGAIALEAAQASDQAVVIAIGECMEGDAGRQPELTNSMYGRVDPSLLMSTNTKKSSEDVKGLGGGQARHNKSSDRLHRIGGGGSSTNLTQNKRSKSHSQLMSAGKKKREETIDDEEGWTSSSQKGTPENSRSPSSESDEEDEGLVMGAKKKQNQRAATKEGTAMTATTPKMQDADRKEDAKAPLKRTDTQVTLRGFHATPTQQSIPLPLTSTPIEEQQQELEEPPRQRTQSAAHSQAGSDDTLAQGPSTPEHPHEDSNSTGKFAASQRPPIDRGMSSASARTLTTQELIDETSSPASNRSKASIRSRSSLYPRESQGPAAPKLSTQYALAGALGSLQEDSEMEQAMGQRRRYLSEVGISNSRSESSHLKDRSFDSNYMIKSARRKSSISSIQSNTIRLPHASPSLADISLGAVRAEHSQQGSGSNALDAMQRASASGFQTGEGRKQYDRRRTTSTQSLSAADAANLATRLRMARGESFDEAHSTTASKLLANSNSKYFSSSNRNDMAPTKAMKEYNKPTISTFVKRQGERKNIEVKVDRGSLFDEDFARARLSGKGKNAVGKERADSEDDNDEEPDSVRYVMDFGLSGPAIQKTATTEALLGTLLDHDEFEATWAPALANAAGLGEGTRRAREAAREGGGLDNMHLNGMNSTGGVAVNGPNATPMHFLHGLTNTTDAPFPLDASDMIANPHDPSNALVQSEEYLDAKNLRSIAMTWTALNVNKGHVVTRRYVDPMRESLERLGKASGMMSSKWVSTPSGSLVGPPHYSNNVTPTNGSTTPGGSLRWGGWRNLFSEQHTLREEA